MAAFDSIDSNTNSSSPNPDSLNTTNYLLAADNHNLGNTQTSWYDVDSWGTKFGNAGKLAATSILSGANSFYNTGVTVGNWFGADLEQNKTEDWISGIDSDLGSYYRANQESADLGGFILGSLIPGIGGVKIINAGQKILQGASKTGLLGGNLGRALGLLAPNTERYVALAAEEISQSTNALKLLNTATTKALASGLWQSTLESAAFETVVQVSMFKSPILEKQDVRDILTNVAVGGVLGGVIGGAFSTAKILGGLKVGRAAEDLSRMPFQERPQFSTITSPAEKIIQLAYDTETRAIPIVMRDAEGQVVNNAATNKTLFADTVKKNNLAIRDNINTLAGKDTELGNILANGAYKGPLTEDMAAYQGSSQEYLQNFLGTKKIVRATEITSEEKAYADSLKMSGIKEPVEPIAARYIKIIGEDAGTVTDSLPAVLSLGDRFKGQDAIMKFVKAQGFKVGDMWDAQALKGSGLSRVSEAEARHIWAQGVGIKDGSVIHLNDIPLLERAYELGVTNVEIRSGKGPTLESIFPSSRNELYQILKESKLETAGKIITSKDPVRSTEIAGKIANVKTSYLEGTHAQDEFSDLMARQSEKQRYFKDLLAKQLPLSSPEAIDPVFLPKYAKAVYSVSDNAIAADGNVMNGITFLKSQQKIYQDDAKRVVAKVIGNRSNDLPDITDTALTSANRNGAGAGLFSSENSNYGTLGSSMAWIGSVTRDVKATARGNIGKALESPLVSLGKNPEAAIEFESLNQQITRSGKQWILDEDNHALMSLEKPGIEPEYLNITNQETLNAISAHIAETGKRTDSFREIRAAQGFTDHKNPDVFRPIRPNLKDYPHFAFVSDPQVTGTGHVSMIHAATEKDLAALITKVPDNYRVLTKTEVEDFKQARHEYEYSRTLHDNYIDSDLANRGIFSNFFPKTDPDKIINDVLQQHYRESDVLTSEAIRLRYEPQFGMLEDLGKSYSKLSTSRFASNREMIENTSDNPYFNYIKTALDISKTSEHPLIYGFNKSLDEAVSKFTGGLKDIFQTVKTPDELGKINAALDKYGMKPAYYDAALNLLANHEAPKGVLTKFVRAGNSLLSLFTLGLDPLNSLNNAVGANILRMTELKYLTNAINAGNAEAAGDLAQIAKISLPGTGDQILSPTKLVGKAIQNFWEDDGKLISKYKADGYIKDRLEQLKLLVDDFTLKGTESVKELNTRISSGFAKAKDLAQTGERLSGNKLAEEFNRFISADVMRQITDVGMAHGLIDAPTSKAYINTFVNRVEGNITASQRPLIFQGPIGQAIGLFQSYQFNLLQQLFRYTAEGTKKDLGTLLGLQSTLYGAQSLPAFQFINTHIVGQMSGNSEHRDAYDATYGAAGRTAGDWLLYGIPSNILQGNLYSRGDINPRQITVLPTSLQETPIVSGWGKFLGNMKETVGKIANGGNIWESILQGVEHNGISRPLAGMAQVLQATSGGPVYSTSSKGSILYSNDLMSWASVVRLAGGRPLDEAIVNDALFRVKTYQAARTMDMGNLGEAVKTSLIQGNEPDAGQLNGFAQRYAQLGGKQAGFNKYMMSLYKNANIPQSQQLEMNLKNPFSYKMQLLMGGEEE